MKTILGLSLFLSTLAYAELPEPARPYILSLAEDESFLSARPVAGDVSYLTHKPSASRWRFHRDADGSYRIQSLDLGKSWLALGAKDELVVKTSDSALSSRWWIRETEQGLLIQNFARSDKSFRIAIEAQAESLDIDLKQGDIISLQSLAKGDRVWLDGNTNNGRLGLTTKGALPGSSGARWRVHDNDDGSFSLECLGNVPGPRWLKIDGAVPALANTNDKNESTKWKLIKNGDGRYSFQNLSYRGRGAALWLDSYPALGLASLAGAQADNPGTQWGIHIQSRADYAVTGRWSAVEELPFSGIHSHTLPNGKVLSWSRYKDPTDQGSTIEGVTPGEASTFVFDPESAIFEAISNPETDAFCSGHSFLPDGRLLVTGGHIRSNVGPKSTQIFDPKSKLWSTSPDWDMNAGRWYPTNVTLANGDVLTVSGDATSADDVNRIPQVWSFTDSRWRDLPGLASSCFNETKGPCMPLYPWLHLAPNGKVFVSGPGQQTGYIDTKGEGTWKTIARTQKGYRGDYEATSIQYAPGKIMITGGIPTTASVELIDLNAKEPAWQKAEPMLYKRHKHTSTILADGEIFVSGGLETDGNSDNSAVYPSEIWNPDIGRWTEADAIRVPRLYHSTAVLLADGRVLSTGGGLGAGFATHKNFQIYNPPYLYKGKRPRLDLREGNSKRYGDELLIGTDDAASIRKAHLIRLSSDTHSFNSSQTIVPLNFRPSVERSRDVQGLILRLPTDSRIAPPGYYFLFIVDKDGIPSIGKSVQIL